MGEPVRRSHCPQHSTERSKSADSADWLCPPASESLFRRLASEARTRFVFNGTFGTGCSYIRFSGRFRRPLRFHDQGQSFFLASGGEDHRVYVWHRRHRRLLRRLCGHTEPVNAVSWSKGLLASASDDHCIIIWSTPLTGSDSRKI